MDDALYINMLSDRLMTFMEDRHTFRNDNLMFHIETAAAPTDKVTQNMFTSEYLDVLS